MTNDPYSPVAEKRSVAVGPLVWGTILIVVGAGWLLAALDVATIPWRAALAAVLILVGIAMLITTVDRTAPEGLFTAGTILAVVLALLSTASSAFALPLAGGVGERTVAPTFDTLESEYRLIAGQLDIDLGNVTFPDGETRLEVSATFGQIRVHNIPDGVAVSVDARITAGELLLLGSRWDGVNIKQVANEPGFATAPRRLIVEARVGFGQVKVIR